MVMGFVSFYGLPVVLIAAKVVRIRRHGIQTVVSGLMIKPYIEGVTFSGGDPMY